MTAKHTAGPWAIANHHIGFVTGRTLTIAGANGADIAQLPENGKNRDHMDANARLIAAAPELLDVLTLALPYVECATEDQGYKAGAVAKMVRQIRAAIAKAEGETT